MAKLRLLRVQGVRVEVDKGEVSIEKLTFSFDQPQESPSIDLDLLEVVELAVAELKTGRIEAQVITNSAREETATEKCPYCKELDRNSDDHIFPAFLGGTATIRVCKSCNDTFGHDFEAAVAENLGPLQVFLRACGLKAPRSILWKRAFVDETSGVELDLDSELRARPSKPQIPNETSKGSRQAIFRNRKEAQRFLDTLRDRGLIVDGDVREQVDKGIIPKLRSFNVPIGPELRRLVVKMCVGVAEKSGNDGQVIEPSARSFLLGATHTDIPVRIAYLSYDSLDKNRPPLSHVVFVAGDNSSKKCYGIVQFFGTIQLFVVLHANFLGESFAILATLNPVTAKETFTKTEYVELPEAPRFISSEDRDKGLRHWAEKLNHQITSGLGSDRGTIRIDPGK